jgi:homoserine O-acetyltransferase/O-succinyltransferase
MFDTNRFFVICTNALGGCQGSTGPSSPAPDGKPYGMRFPIITIEDMINAQTHLLDRLSIKKLFAVAVGWSVYHPARVGACIFLASTWSSSAQQIAFHEVGRQAIYADPNWNKGDYYGENQSKPNQGLSIARMLGHITYLSSRSMQAKFGRRWIKKNNQKPSLDSADFEVESYLKYQGERFVKRFDANRYLYITKAIDLFDIKDGFTSLKDALDRTRCPFLIVSFTADWLYTAEPAIELMKTLVELGRKVERHHLEAHFGHDSFVVESELIAEVVSSFLRTLSEI